MDYNTRQQSRKALESKPPAKADPKPPSPQDGQQEQVSLQEPAQDPTQKTPSTSTSDGQQDGGTPPTFQFLTCPSKHFVASRNSLFLSWQNGSG